MYVKPFFNNHTLVFMKNEKWTTKKTCYLFSLPNYSPYIRIYWDEDWEKTFTGIHERTTELPSRNRLDFNRFASSFINLIFILTTLLSIVKNLATPYNVPYIMYTFSTGSVYLPSLETRVCFIVYLPSLEARFVSLYTCPPWRLGLYHCIPALPGD